MQDRLIETGVLDDWQERVEHNEEVVPCEIELWFRNDPWRRRAASDRVTAMVDAIEGRILGRSVIEEIAYHALLVQLPIGSVSLFIDQSVEDSSLIQCKAIQFFRATGQMAGILPGDESWTEAFDTETGPPTLDVPVVALFDGLPVQNHQRLADRLVIDDPDHYLPC